MAKSKYNAKKIEFNGIKFDSVMERDYYIYLTEELKLEDGKDFERQPVFELQPKFYQRGKNIRAITYKGDYIVNNNVIDIKGFETTDFKIKKKLFQFKYPELDLICITAAPKYTGKKWIELEELKKIRRNRK